MTPCIGIDLGGTKTEVAVLDAQGHFLWRHREPTPAHDYAAMLDLMVALVRQAIEACDLPWPSRIGCGIPGTLDPVTHSVRGANTQALNGQPLARDLSTMLNLQVRVQNDANCLAVSEAVDGAGAGAEMVFAVILGTGCGGGLAFQQRVHTGRNALAGEWGHNPLPWPTLTELQAPPCWCGLQGCLETWVSGPGWARAHQRDTGELLTPPHIWSAMQSGNVSATHSVAQWLDRLARGLSQVVNLIDPDRIVLGGGLSNLPGMAERVEPLISRYAFHRGARTPVRVAMHGDSSGVRGAAWLAHDASA